ncbi:MAG: hypothetical protein ABR923_11065 [Terracidiphilus sp.]
MTSRMRELIQQLGEAIHESVIESEQIAGVVQDIRKHGFDVLLMLEATIGLNEVSAKDSDEAPTTATKPPPMPSQAPAKRPSPRTISTSSARCASPSKARRRTAYGRIRTRRTQSRLPKSTLFRAGNDA